MGDTITLAEGGAAWGDLASDADIAPMVEQIGTLNLICLGTNASGSPKHPMARGKARIPDDQEPLPFSKILLPVISAHSQ